jgi:hypothetical protein
VEENSVRKYRKLTLDSNGSEVIVPFDNVALIIRIEAEDENKKKFQFTRVWLKEADMPEGKYVDVRELPDDII